MLRLALLIATCVAAQAFLFTPKSGKVCKSNSDCASTECCIHDPFAGFGRDIFSSSWMTEQGNCSPRKQEGEFCSPLQTHRLLFGRADMHTFTCPCQEGLICEAEEKTMKDGMTIHRNTQCVVPEGSGEGQF